MLLSSVMAMATAFFFVSIVPIVGQSIPGAELFVGGGTPGGTYELVDDYETVNFFDKFNYYNVSSQLIGLGAKCSLAQSCDPTYGHVQYAASWTPLMIPVLTFPDM